MTGKRFCFNIESEENGEQNYNAHDVFYLRILHENKEGKKGQVART